MLPEPDTQPLKLLLLEDDPQDARLLRGKLALAAPGRFNIVHCDRLAAALARLAAGEAFDAALLDLSLPDSDGLETFRTLREQAPTTPILIMTGFDDQTTARSAVRAGAQDYLIKGHVDGDLIRRSIDYAIERVGLLAELDASRRQQAELKDQFLSHVSHELRMPLTVIYQAIANLLSGAAGQLNSQQRECLEIAEPNVQQLRKMIDELLEIARSDAGFLRIEAQPMDLKELLTRSVRNIQPVAQAKNIRLDSPAFPERLPMVRADPRRIAEVFMNLVDNAFKFTPPGGEIRVGAQHLTEEPAWVRVMISDTGCGISTEAKERIFARMHQESQPIESSRMGLGIGLYLVKEIIVRHGGRIWVESEPGQGSTFYFTLPIYDAAAKPAAAPAQVMS